MRTKKVISIVLTASFLLGLTSCSAITKNQESQKFIKALEKIDFKKYSKKKDLENGAYETVKSPDTIEDFFDQFDFPVPDEDDIARLTYGLRQEENDDDTLNQFVSFHAEFKDEDDAEDYFDDVTEYYSDVFDRYEILMSYAEVGFEEDDDATYFALNIEDGDDVGTVRFMCAVDDSRVFFVLSVGYYDASEEYSDLADDLCEALKYDAPSDCL